MDARIEAIRKRMAKLIDELANLDDLYNRGVIDFETYVRGYRSTEEVRRNLLAEVEQIINSEFAERE